MGNRESSDISDYGDYECKKCEKDFSSWIKWRTHQALCRKNTGYDFNAHDDDDDDDSDDGGGGGNIRFDIDDDGEDNYIDFNPRVRAHTFEGIQRLDDYLTNSPFAANTGSATSQPAIGTRVVRGPTWRHRDEDSGEGGVGTITASEDFLSRKCVNVIWDNGNTNSYRSSQYGSFDLLILDTSTAVPNSRHFAVCDVCYTDLTQHYEWIRGTRWKCQDCADYDLCTSCYFNDEHDLQHKFWRHDTKDSERVPVPARRGSKRAQMRGLFPTAKVVLRENEDPTEPDQEGTIISNMFMCDTVREAVLVEWENGKTEVCQVGFGGEVNLKCLTPANGGHYYPDHLPMCGDASINTALEASHSAGNLNFRIGDRVMIALPEDLLQRMMETYGEWDVETTQLIGKPGTVTRISAGNDILVEYDLVEMGLNLQQTTWSFHQILIGKVEDESNKEEAVVQEAEVKAEETQAEETTPVDVPGTADAEKEEKPEEAATSSYADDICQLCEEVQAIITFRPCGHQIVCQACSVRLKKCFACKVAIEEKVLPLDEENKKLKIELDELREMQRCQICANKRKNTAFAPCGHSACEECSSRLTECPICRIQITGRLKVFM